MESTGLSENDAKVFKAIETVMLESDFKNATVSFIEANYDKFEDTEENKLEYTEIHNEYLKIVEQVLELQVKERYAISDAEMDEFYGGFTDKSKLAEYESLSKDTVDHLFTMIDFVHFKNLMLQTKKSASGNEVDAGTATELTKQAQDSALILGTTYEQFLKMYNEDISTWKLKMTTKSKDFAKQGFKLTVYQRKQEG